MNSSSDAMALQEFGNPVSCRWGGEKAAMPRIALIRGAIGFDLLTDRNADLLGV